MAKNLRFHVRTKHIESDYHFVHEKVVMGHWRQICQQSTSLFQLVFPLPDYSLNESIASLFSQNHLAVVWLIE